MGCAMLNENNFIVFGGYNQRMDQYSSDTFLINAKKANNNEIAVIAQLPSKQLTSISAIGVNPNLVDDN